MKRTSNSLILIAALVAGLAAAHGCNFTAGVNNTSGNAGTTGAAGTGAAGTTGTAGVSGNPFTGTGGGAGTGLFMPKPCEGLQCTQSTCRGEGCKTVCQGDARTTISGTVYDPAGNVPLYNIAVYVPNKPLDPIADGPSCDKCDPDTGTSSLSGQPLTVTKSGTDGSFKLGASGLKGDVPSGTDIPLVIQVGKWQRKVTIPTVTPCVDNPILDKDLTRLPRNSTEGHIPKMAITSGQADALQCLLLKVGVDKAEFTTEAGPGRINIYAGGGGSSSFADPATPGGATFTPVNPWWDSYDNLAKYDIVLHSCEGGDGDYNAATAKEPTSIKSMAAREALEKFANMGGRVFASHWHSYWFELGTPSFKSIATFGRRNGLPNPYTATIDQSFDTGKALAQWLVSVNGSPTLGSVVIAQNASNRLIDAAAGGKTSQRWIYADTLTPKSVQFLSATTPIPGGTCGRAVISDLHVTSGTNNMAGDQPTMPFPTSCVTTTLEPREKVLEFMLFDIASCVKPIIE